LIRAIVPKIDVVVENFTPGVMARAGLGYEQLSAIHPQLIMCSISLAGQNGPLSQKPGFDYVGAAANVEYRRLLLAPRAASKTAINAAAGTSSSGRNLATSSAQRAVSLAESSWFSPRRDWKPAAASDVRPRMSLVLQSLLPYPHSCQGTTASA